MCQNGIILIHPLLFHFTDPQMKNNHQLFFTLLASIAMLICPSCSDNDKTDELEPDTPPSEPAPSKSISGTWRHDNGDDSDNPYILYYFGPDDQGAYWEQGLGGDPFKYKYDKSSGTVEIDDGTPGYTEILRLSSMTSKSMDIDGLRFYSTDLTYEYIILGQWLFHVNMTDLDKQDSKTLTRIIFNIDGTYEAKDRLSQAELDNSFQSLPDSKYGTYTIEDSFITFSGNSDIAGRYIIDGLVINGCRLIRADHPDEYPYIIGSWFDR